MKFGFEGGMPRNSFEEKDANEKSIDISEIETVADELTERASRLPEPNPELEELEIVPANDLGDTVRQLREQK